MDRKELNEIIEKALLQLKTAPQGKLYICKKTDKVYQFYQITEDGKKRYLTRDEAPLIKQLAQKRYSLSVLKEANRLIGKIQNGRNQKNKLILGEIKIKQVYEKLPDTVKKMVKTYTPSYKEYGETWAKTWFKQKPISEDTRIYITDNGEKVRSKSELIIANKLRQLGLYYRYECQRILYGFGPVYPDFTILDPNTDKEVILEHFGMMDDMDYVNKMIRKLRTYNENNIWYWNDLLCTFESSDNPIDISILETMLRKRFKITRQEECTR